MATELKYPRKYKIMMLIGGVGCLAIASFTYFRSFPDVVFAENARIALQTYYLWLSFSLMLTLFGLLTLINFLISLLYASVSVSHDSIVVRGPFGWPRRIQAKGTSIAISSRGALILRRDGKVRAKALRGTFEQPLAKEFIKVAKSHGVEVLL